MTEKLYEQDSMLKSCLATVLSCAEDKRGYAVVLDRTVFFPEGGGQLSDRGTLGGVKMTYAAQRGSEVVHYCERPLPVGAQVEAVLDWQARLDHMQQHAGSIFFRMRSGSCSELIILVFIWANVWLLLTWIKN